MHDAAGEGSERARDLVDLQLLDKGEDLDPEQVATTYVRLFGYRRQQAWLPFMAASDQWSNFVSRCSRPLV